MISEKDYNQSVKDYTKNLFRFLFKSLKDEDAVNDIVQDCFMKLWQNRLKIDQQKIKQWLFAVAHHGMINYLKSSSRKISLSKIDKAPEVFQKHDFDTKAIIDRALNELPPLQKSILLLRDLEGYEYKEIGEILELSGLTGKSISFSGAPKGKELNKGIDQCYMKDNLHNLYDDEADKLLFDYLEGGLPKEAAAELEEELASNLTLQEELKHWKDSFVEQAFYDTSLLEEQLQQKIFRDTRYSTESYILIVALFTSFLSFMPFTIEKAQMQSGEVVETLLTKNLTEVKNPAATLDHQTEAEIPLAQTAVKEILNNENPSQLNQSTEKEGDKLNIKIIKPLPAEGILLNRTHIIDKKNLKELPTGIKKTNKPKQNYSSKISRKDQRAIDRAKEKVLQKRMEENFMRGREPYVVPLNPNF